MMFKSTKKSFITSNYHFIQLNRWEMFYKASHSVLIYALHNNFFPGSGL